jgi:hypothetical protein
VTILAFVVPVIVVVVVVVVIMLVAVSLLAAVVTLVVVAAFVESRNEQVHLDALGNRQPAIPEPIPSEEGIPDGDVGDDADPVVAVVSASTLLVAVPMRMALAAAAVGLFVVMMLATFAAAFLKEADEYLGFEGIGALS